ncbi:uncharacterized protein [Paramisgurnus dabryanus]|uniref:uncharacterized protein isoform X2 n=1 Tax=Paramisgurnus dabryanus TaxID=90735 RepID=UPI003CCF2216
MMSGPQSVVRRYWIQLQQMINWLWLILGDARNNVSWLCKKIVKIVQILWQQMINCLWFIFGILLYIVIKIKQTCTWLFNGINKAKRNNYYIIQSGNSCNAQTRILDYLREHVPGMTEVNKVDECDVILVFCPIVSRAGTDIDAALYQLNNCSDSKPAVFMVLHHTFDREKVLPDSSRFITRGNTLTVNCLFNEDEGLLASDMNDVELGKIFQRLKPQQRINCLWFIIGIAQGIVLWPYQQMINRLWLILGDACQKIGQTWAWLFNGNNKAKRNNCYIIQSGNSRNAHTKILETLHEHVPGMTEVNKVEKCDVILVFCPIVSRAGTDIQAALDQLNNCSESKPAVFMVLHHTFDREKVLPDSSRFITRGNTLTVNCLFNEDEGLLACDTNDVELDKIIQRLKPQQRINCLWFIIGIAQGIVLWPYQQMINRLWLILGDARQKIGQTWAWYIFNWINKAKRNNYYIIQSGNSRNAHTKILKNLHEHVPGMTEVNKVDECDMILVFCPIVSRAGTDIDAALYQLNNCSESKPAVFMVLHHTFDREKVLPDSSSFITRGNTLTVNFLFHEDVGLHKCNMNKAAQAKIIQYLNRQNTGWYRKSYADKDSNV